jgi:hypothetical protein
MNTVNIVHTESTPVGEMAELILEKHITPVVGMILIDEDSLTWEITAVLQNANSTTDNHNAKLYTLRCSPVNSEKPIHTGIFKLMH